MIGIVDATEAEILVFVCLDVFFLSLKEANLKISQCLIYKSQHFLFIVTVCAYTGLDFGSRRGLSMHPFLCGWRSRILLRHWRVQLGAEDLI